MNKETLIERLKSKAFFRRKLLFEHYESLMSESDTAFNISQEINRDLGVPNLVGIQDINFCRRYFLKRNFKAARKKQTVKTTINHSNFDDLTWTNPADLEKVTLKSKFVKT